MESSDSRETAGSGEAAGNWDAAVNTKNAEIMMMYVGGVKLCQYKLHI